MQLEVTGKKIESIKIDKKNATISFLDGDELTITIDTYSHFYLYKDKELSLENINEIVEYDDISKAKGYALKLLNIKNYSSNQIKEKLLKKYSLKTSLQTIHYLEESSLIDDKKYALEKVDLMNKKGYGINRIGEELKKAKISQKIINEIDFDEDNELIKANKQFNKYFNSSKNKSYEKRKQGGYVHLLTLGFSPSLANRVIESFNSEEEKLNDELLIKKEMSKYINSRHLDLNVYQNKQKLINHLLNKGYDYELIKRTMEDTTDE